MSLRLDRSRWQELQRLATANDATASEVVRHLLERGMDEAIAAAAESDAIDRFLDQVSA